MGILRHFVETGTGRGDGLRHAAGFPFERLYSVEVVAAQVTLLRQDFAGDPRIQIGSGESAPFLAELRAWCAARPKSP